VELEPSLTSLHGHVWLPQHAAGTGAVAPLTHARCRRRRRPTASRPPDATKVLDAAVSPATTQRCSRPRQWKRARWLRGAHAASPRRGRVGGACRWDC